MENNETSIIFSKDKNNIQPTPSSTCYSPSISDLVNTSLPSLSPKSENNDFKYIDYQKDILNKKKSSIYNYVPPPLPEGSRLFEIYTVHQNQSPITSTSSSTPKTMMENGSSVVTSPSTSRKGRASFHVSSIPQRQSMSLTIDPNRKSSFSEKQEMRKEEIVHELLNLIDRLINSRRLYFTFLDLFISIYAIVSSLIFMNATPIIKEEIHYMYTLLLIYGWGKFLVSLTYIFSYLQTKTRITSSIGGGFQIIVGVLTIFFYILITLFTLIIGVIGFYKCLFLNNLIDYKNENDQYHTTPIAYRTTLCIFTLQICSIVVKCCCCKNEKKRKNNNNESSNKDINEINESS
uniref:Ion_trans domain-containing protein n=1 Tax=Strongyloides stercoralis TaxID=6248 RepID=A0A0K0EKZ6_STRER